MAAKVKASLAIALAALGGSPAEAERLAFTSAEPRLPSHLAVDEIAAACVGSALTMAAKLGGAPGGPNLAAELDGREVQASIRSERYFRAGGEPAGAGFAPQSRFWPTADGWVRTHANYPWHLEALLDALEAPDVESLAGLIGSMPAAEVEERAFAAGGIAAAVRTPEEWRSHPQGAAVATEPLVARERLADAPARRRDAPAPAGGHPAPAAGVRVLDLTRVIAGPVGTRYLGALGAEVLRLDPPGLPDLQPNRPADTLLAKRSTFLDLGTPEGAATLEALLADADVVIEGYRPGSLDRFGLAPPDLAERHPGLVVVQLAAWGHSGPWAGRRGFDSIVQAASGIAAAEATDDGSPGALPCQLLDHGTGYLAATAALEGLSEQRRDGGSHVRRLSLARVAAWLLETSIDATGKPGPSWVEAPREEPALVAGTEPDRPGKVEAPGEEPVLVDLAGPIPVSAVPPPGRLGDVPLRWPEPTTVYGGDAPGWSR